MSSRGSVTKYGEGYVSHGPRGVLGGLGLGARWCGGGGSLLCVRGASWWIPDGRGLSVTLPDGRKLRCCCIGPTCSLFSVWRAGPSELLVIWGHVPAQGSGSGLKPDLHCSQARSLPPVEDNKRHLLCRDSMRWVTLGAPL